EAGASFSDGLFEFGVMLPGIAEFWSGKVTIEEQSCFSAQGPMVYLAGYRLTDLYAAFILPDDGRCERLTGFVIPYYERFPLIIESQRGDLVFLQEWSSR